MAIRESILAVLLLLQPARQGLVPEVRAAAAKKDFAQAESLIQTYRSARGPTPEMIEALSWMARAALGANDLERASAYAAETRRLALEELKDRPLDAEKRLPTALGASIEVAAQTMTARGERDQAVVFLRSELKRWWDTSIRTRIQKNVNLLSLEGKPAPALDAARWIGPKPPPLAALKGRAVLLFFWAHWCPDCKRQAPALAKLLDRYGSRGLVVLGPTQLYGYAARGQQVPPETELRYLDEVRRNAYAGLEEMPVPVSGENFKNYGASTTPTLVLVGPDGIVRLYHPGALDYDRLAERVEAVLGS